MYVIKFCNFQCECDLFMTLNATISLATNHPSAAVAKSQSTAG
jgi:hypothetical protein